ncbi:MAG TPA: hydrogenase maturation protease [Herpetosiphonaceae bacterium]|nr:hydrogenase maturation protease [Herpetosiphonaceae bacterium]
MSGILIAGMGNVLRRDDGFGVEVARRLARDHARIAAESHTRVKIIEVGIGGIHLVQELMDGYDVLVIADAMERGSPPGTVHVLEAEVEDLGSWTEDERGDFLADMHYTTPSKALILAKALGVLPPSVFIVGCQPAEIGDLGIGLSDPVARAVPMAVCEIDKLVTRPPVVQEGRR